MLLHSYGVVTASLRNLSAPKLYEKESNTREIEYILETFGESMRELSWGDAISCFISVQNDGVIPLSGSGEEFVTSAHLLIENITANVRFFKK